MQKTVLSSDVIFISFRHTFFFIKQVTKHVNNITYLNDCVMLKSSNLQSLCSTQMVDLK